MTLHYVQEGRKQAAKKMEAARVLWDSAKTMTARNSAHDDFLFWQAKFVFFESELRAITSR